jgi:hypothetical protein
MNPNGEDLMLVRLACAVALAGWILLPHGASAQNCADEISKLMSKDTEKLTTRYQRVTRQIQEKGSSQKLVQEECRIARELRPRLEDQLAAMKQSGCVKDPQMGNMIADIVRGHEGDLAMARATTARSECR